jgi:hypothetical protein
LTVAANDLLTLAEAYRALNDQVSADRVSADPPPSPTTRDLEMAVWVSGMSERIDDLCGPVVIRARTKTRMPGRERLLIEGPVASVTSLTYGDPPTTLDPATYELEVTKLLTIVHPKGTVLPASRAGFTVTWQTGRVADTASVSAKFKLAAGAILRRLNARDGGAWARGGDPFTESGTGPVGFFRVVDPAVDEFLADELLPPAVA